jgi:ATPase involved in DNA repair/ATPase family associated with various cellular activities (AAA)
MADPTPPALPTAAPSAPAALAGATYEIIRQRLAANSATLRERMGRLDARRQEVFGRIESRLLQADRVTTGHNCVPRDMVQVGSGRFLFGFNVQFGLKKEVELSDVFAVFARDEQAGTFKEAPLDALCDKRFLGDFKRLYNVYERTTFSKFSLIDGQLYMVFRTGAGVNDIAAFKWAYNGGALVYADGRAEAEFRRVAFPAPFEFRWRTPDREAFRYGDHPHVSIEDRVFVECVGGDLTIKVEDNTATGEGVYSEPVEDRHQKVDDAEISYALVGHLILLKIRPYKEAQARFFIFNGKLQSAVRVDSLGTSCALLPEDHGLIFPDGFYLATGGLKVFEAREGPMVLERVIHGPSGEDSLYVFFNRETGGYALLPYRLIEQKVDERIVCQGFSLFPNGHLVLFRADEAPQKHHQIQLRQTPFYQLGNEPAGRREAFLYQVGNKDVVRCLAECNEVLTLAGRENPYSDLYTDLVRRCTAMLDAYPWLADADGFQIDEALRQVREVSDRAVDEFAKVRRLQHEAVLRVADVRKRCEGRFQAVRRAGLGRLEDFVHNLAALRQLRGELITLRELRYIDLAALGALEQSVVAQNGELAAACVKFLLKPEALEPYRKQAAEHLAGVEKVAKVADGRKLEKAVSDAGGELEMLIEIVNGLKIEDATETTRIIDGITAVYSTLNQVKAGLKKHLQALVTTESAAQFNAQVKLLGQSASSYLDLCDSPEKCDGYLNRLTVQLEELEGAFAGFDEYTVQLSERRTEFHEAFEQRKIALVEQRNRRSGALLAAAERILKVIQNRLGGSKTLEEIHAYMAADLMPAKVRETVAQLLELGDSVKADDLQGRLKTVQQEALRQLKDRQELFVDGTAVIQLGKHRFNVNTQALDLTILLRDGQPQFHLTSTKYFDPITDAAYLATRDAWDQEVVSENAEVYRSEYLAWQMMKALDGGGGPLTLDKFQSLPDDQRLAAVQEFMATRYQDGYVRGLHDLDGARILSALVETHLALRRAKHGPAVRACAVVYWWRFCPAEVRTLWSAKLRGFAERNRLFPGDTVQHDYIGALQFQIAGFLKSQPLYPGALAAEAGEYLFHELTDGDTFTFTVTREAADAAMAFGQHLVAKGYDGTFATARTSLAAHPSSELELVRDWVRGFLLERGSGSGEDVLGHLEEIAALLFCGETLPRCAIQAGSRRVLEAMHGAHPRLAASRYVFDYIDFTRRLRRFEADAVPKYEAHHRIKGELLDRERRRLRLEEFRPRVLSSFVRNQLTDRVYLPMIGDNLAKQIGAAGAAKRTDLMGLLLLVSPPGYGKTTLLEYVASRLGIVFVKVNGPAIGHDVASLDPEEAPNAAAREEIQKLNLALEMGDNTMICIDDIQHCNPEFLQKFISLCDGQRKMEGVWRGQPRTYDLRGRKVVVVMAGNPYTESGQKFKIPDMLANRADTYNLGDIIGGNAEWFRASYLENAITSNPVLAPLANRSQRDIRAFIRMAETGQRTSEGLEGNYSAPELGEILAVLAKLVSVRDVVMRVNAEYIASAAQADEFRTEPPFRLQGSYRNMNRLAEKVAAIQDDAEVQALVVGHYRGESQTLTTGAEANMLKFRGLIGLLTAEESARWEEIRKTFRRNQYTRGSDQNDPVGRVVAQLSLFQSGLEAIQATLAGAVARPPAPVTLDIAPLENALELLRATLEERLGRPHSGPAPVPVTVPDRSRDLDRIAAGITEGLKALGETLSHARAVADRSQEPARIASLSHEMEMIHSTLATLKDLSAQQRDHLRNARDLLAARAKQGTVEVEVTQEMLANEHAFMERLHQELSRARSTPEPDR